MRPLRDSGPASATSLSLFIVPMPKPHLKAYQDAKVHIWDGQGTNRPLCRAALGRYYQLAENMTDAIHEHKNKMCRLCAGEARRFISEGVRR